MAKVLWVFTLSLQYSVHTAGAYTISSPDSTPSIGGLPASGATKYIIRIAALLWIDATTYGDMMRQYGVAATLAYAMLWGENSNLNTGPMPAIWLNNWIDDMLQHIRWNEESQFTGRRRENIRERLLHVRQYALYPIQQFRQIRFTGCTKSESYHLRIEGRVYLLLTHEKVSRDGDYAWDDYAWRYF